MNLYWQLVKNIYHYLQARLWQVVYGYPDKAMTLYAITGTNGKTTTCYILTSILEQAYGAEAVGMLTTVALRVGKRVKTNTTKMTTLPSRTVFAYLANMKKAGVRHVVVEVTSHALDQHRLAGLEFAGGIVLNLTREHLDYHLTMERYEAAKRNIIRYLQPHAPLVGKSDNEYVRHILTAARVANHPQIGFTAEDAKRQETPLAGEVNRENALAARLLAQALHIPEAAISAGIAAVAHVPGRMECIAAPSGFSVIIDYAVTPDALERLYAAARAETNGKVYGILGAAGLRDRGKRADMAAAVAKYADEFVLTREDPWTESEDQIFSDLEKGLTGKHNWKKIVDRAEALRYVLSKAQAGDIVIATGKGAEEGMAIGKTIVPWNEHKVIEDILQA